MYKKMRKHYEKGEHHKYEHPTATLSEHLSPKMDKNLEINLKMEHGVLGEYHEAKKKHMPKLQEYKIYPNIEVE